MKKKIWSFKATLGLAILGFTYRINRNQNYYEAEEDEELRN